MLVAFDVVQHEHAARARWQSGDGLLEIEEIAGSERGAYDPRNRVDSTAVLLVGLLDSRPLSAVRLSRVEHDVHGQPVQPRPEGALTAEQVQLFPGTDEDVLGQFLRARAVAGHP